MATEEEETTQDSITWTASWGDRVRVGDLIRINKLGGPVRITELRKFITPVDQKRTPLSDDDPSLPWYYGCVVEDRLGQQYHLFLQPAEAIFIAVRVPEGMGE